MADKPLNARNRRVLHSVFPQTNSFVPTPVVTPATGFTTPGQPFGAPLSQINRRNSLLEARGVSGSRGIFSAAEDHIEDQVRWDRAWHLVTRTLSFPTLFSVQPPNADGTGDLNPDKNTLDNAFHTALKDILNPSRLPLARQTEDLIDWYTLQVRTHFLGSVLPTIQALGEDDEEGLVLNKSITILTIANRNYFHTLSLITDGITSEKSEGVWEKFRRDLNAVVSNTVALDSALKNALSRYVSTILGLPEKGAPKVPPPESPETEKARHELLDLVEAFRNVGLVGERFQTIFAEVMHNTMSEYIYRAYSEVWSDDGTISASRIPRIAQHALPSHCVAMICEWIENRYAKLAVQVFGILDVKDNISWTDKEKYKEIGIGRLAELRINELFDVVVNWPQSKGALDDLRTAITTPQRRLHLTEVFAKNLKEQLLHPGTSTLQILQTYISMICSFHTLDHSKVLLDRVAYPLQLYLCSREDTVRIIITGLLSDTEDGEGNPIQTTDRLVELARLLNKPEEVGQGANDEELDWHDMEWVPDPVDAGPGYKRSKNVDIIGTLIGVLGAQEVFIKEFQNIIGENFLRQDGDFAKEIKVLELLKLRFGEPPLQACEVMLKDIQDSTRLNATIRHKQSLGTPIDVAADPRDQSMSRRLFRQAEATLPGIPRHSSNEKNSALAAEETSMGTSLNAKILSRLFWPSLNDEQYKTPSLIVELQQRYEAGFELLGSARRLTWLPALGQATVELELKDRTVLEEVHTWQAAVIYAFNEDEESTEPLSRTVEQLVEILDMDEDLISSALRFWAHKLVLHESSPGTYTVLETLNTADLARSNAQAASSATPHSGQGSEDFALGLAGRSKRDGIAEDKMGVYWSFVQGMLTNSSKEMPLQQIGMMMKMLIVEGFPYSNEELGEWLGGKVGEGVLEVSGGKYRLRK